MCNLSCGYYKPHNAEETICLNDVYATAQGIVKIGNLCTETRLPDVEVRELPYIQNDYDYVYNGYTCKESLSDRYADYPHVKPKETKGLTAEEKMKTELDFYNITYDEFFKSTPLSVRKAVCKLRNYLSAENDNEISDIIHDFIFD
jgi:hypothetical protein